MEHQIIKYVKSVFSQNFWLKNYEMNDKRFLSWSLISKFLFTIIQIPLTYLQIVMITQEMNILSISTFFRFYFSFENLHPSFQFWKTSSRQVSYFTITKCCWWTAQDHWGSFASSLIFPSRIMILHFFLDQYLKI